MSLETCCFLSAGHDVERLEVVVDVDAEPGPRLRPELLRDFRRLVRHVADVADARLDDVPLAEVAGDGPGLGRGLDDHQPGAVTVAVAAAPFALAPLAVPVTGGRRSYPRPCFLLARSFQPHIRAMARHASAGFPPRSDARPPQVPYAARPRNARPCRYPCNPISRPDCSRRALSLSAGRMLRHTAVNPLGRVPKFACGLRTA